MNEEKKKILEMLENGRINVQEAEQLLDCLEPGGEDTAQKPQRPANMSSAPSASESKKLRIKVDGDTEESKKINVNVSVPLALARVADSIIENCIPNAANDELKKQGIDLKALRIGDMIGTLETLNEDIINADIDSDEAKLKVRIYVD